MSCCVRSTRGREHTVTCYTAVGDSWTNLVCLAAGARERARGALSYSPITLDLECSFIARRKTRRSFWSVIREHLPPALSSLSLTLSATWNEIQIAACTRNTGREGRAAARGSCVSWGAWQPRKTHGYTYVQWKSLQPTATRRRNGPRIDVGTRYSCRIRSLDRASDEPTAAGGGAGASCCPLPGRLAVVGVGHAQALFDFVIRFM